MPNVPTPITPLNPPPPKLNPTQKRLYFLLSLLIILILITIPIGYQYFTSKPLNLHSISSKFQAATDSQPISQSKPLPDQSNPPVKPKPKPSPRTIPHGKIGFSTSQSNKNIPQLSRGYLDPYDPQLNQTQTITIQVAHSKPITQVSAIIQTDNATSDPIEFKLINGTTTDGNWQGFWMVNDTYFYNYVLTLTAQSQSIQSSIPINLR